ncbi:MAG: hypothetical protein CM1200mP3_13850 [Chloroflexota bacterium]|nr:MAG: hypothetical protein CM1200mP3_13850 [Chloroflexota bacterium]
MFRHIGPKTFAPFLVFFTIQLGAVIITEASLSYLGFGSCSSYCIMGYDAWGGLTVAFPALVACFLPGGGYYDYGAGV